MESSDSTLVEAMRIPRMAKACISALHEDNDHNGLKTLRLVRKDMGEALLQCIENYTLRFDLNLGLYPEALDAVTLLNRTRLSSLRVIINIRHGIQGRKVPEEAVVQQTQRFVTDLGPSLASVSSIALEVDEGYSSTTFSSDAQLILRHKQITDAARHILATLAPACPGLQRLHIVCPDPLVAIPHRHCSHVHTLVLGGSGSQPVDHGLISCLQPLLSRLSSLTLLPLPIYQNPLMSLECISTCGNLTYLDHGQQPSTAAMWASLPPNLRELRCRLCEPTPHAPDRPVLFTSLRRIVFKKWGPGESLITLVDVLAAAPGLAEVVLQFRGTPPEDPPRLTVHIGDWTELAALTTLHTRLSRGMRLTTEQQSGQEGPGGLQILSQQEEAGLLFTFMDVGLDEDEPFMPLSHFLKGLQPFPLFTDVSCFCDTGYHLLPVVFPNLSRLAVVGFQHPRELASLARCTSLRSLQILTHGSVSVAALAEALSDFSSLTSFRSGMPLVDGSYSVEESLVLTELLSKSNPGLTITVL